MNAKELYEWMKSALHHFGLDWRDMDKMTISFGDREVMVIYGNEAITLQEDDDEDDQTVD